MQERNISSHNKRKGFLFNMEHRKFKKDDVLFYISIFVAILFLISPLLLRIPLIENTVSYILFPLKEDGFKSSYVETIGAIFGTFFAITGALWTQRNIDLQNEKNVIKEAAVIVYYDFKFAFDDILQFEYAYASISPETANEYDDLEYFCKFRRNQKIYIDSEWICNVAKLCNVLSSEEIKQVYKIYGDFETIKCAFEKTDTEIDKQTAYSIYHLIHRDLCDLTLAPIIEVGYKKINEKLMNKLEMLIKR